MADKIKDEKIKELLKNLAAEFLNRESSGSSLITVTSAEIFDKNKRARIFFTVLPEDKQEAALEFAKRKRPEFREFLKEKSRMRVLPFIDFEIDAGEKRRQKIDELLAKS